MKESSLGGVAQERMEAELAGRGGQHLYSDTTKAAFLAQQHSKVEAELIAAEARQVKVLTAGISDQEAYNKALERHAEAHRRGEKVLYDSNGKPLGYKDTVAEVLEQGKTPARERGGIGGFLSRNFGRRSALSTPLTPEQESRRSYLRASAFFATTTAIGYGTQALDNSAGTAEHAVESGETASYRTKKGIAGTLTYAGVGGAVGMQVGGPWGAAAGAIIGGAYGLYSSLSEVEKEIREVHISSALGEFAQKLSGFNAGTVGMGGGHSFEAFNQLRETRAEISAKAYDDQVNFFRTDASYSRASKQDYTETLKAFGPQAPAIGEYLNKQATELGKGKCWTWQG